MEIQAIFVTGIGITSETSSLGLAQKIFADNKDVLVLYSTSPNFKTSMETYYCEQAVTKNYVNEDDINQLKQVIKHNAFKYLEMIGYDISKFDLKVPNLWLNEMQSGSTRDTHMHYGFTLSGTYYVELPQNSGNILFMNSSFINTCVPNTSIQNYTPFNSGTWSISPKEGDMLFWKSDLLHSVPPAKFDGIRRSIGFDVVMAPKN